jgi:hypothetical protein
MVDSCTILARFVMTTRAIFGERISFMESLQLPQTLERE